ncbi:tyrosine-type recombinase/integrase [Microvirga solisilvae]|uniref:tyrosine-type recombinase/integrase n=1 Tax=Microvirga solisilvae TaxID=2919498 RepID=UPI001FAE950E|nr:site-specific integrase [Microvirga solisilvae]
MSLYTRTDSPYIWAEFWIDGVRFRLSTEETDRRRARVAERRLKLQKKAELEHSRRQEAQDEQRRAVWGGKEPPSLSYVAARYWEEVGQFHTASDTTWRSLEWLVDHFGGETLLTEITAERISSMVAKRRGIRVRRDKETKRLVEIPSDKVENATVNRYATEPLRKLFRRARDVWGYPVPYPAWGEFLLEEPEERVREASPDEEAKIIEKLGPDYGRLFRFMLAAGPRAQGALLTWPQIDWFNRLARIRSKRKKGTERWYTVPLTVKAMAILEECKGHHETFVFTYVARRTTNPGRPGERVKGQRYPITNEGFKSEWRRLVVDTGLAPGFRRHDTRHTTGTRFLRITGNLKATKELLGHKRIETTMRYAHVLVDDIRHGLEAVEQAYTTTANQTSEGAPTTARKTTA